MLFLIFILIEWMQVLNGEEFCDNGLKTKITSAFSHKETIFLIRYEKFWRFDTYKRSVTGFHENIDQLFAGNIRVKVTKSKN